MCGRTLRRRGAIRSSPGRAGAQALTLCGKEKIPAIVRQVSNQQAMVMTLVENLQREDLNQIDQARSYQRLSQEFGLTQDEVAKYTGKERSIANYMRLLRLPEEVQKLLARDILATMGHAKVLLTIAESAPENHRAGGGQGDWAHGAADRGVGGRPDPNPAQGQEGAHCRSQRA